MRWALSVHGLLPLPVPSFCFLFVAEDEISRLPALAAFYLVSSAIMDFPSRIRSPNKFFCRLLLFMVFYLLMVFYPSNRKVANTDGGMERWMVRDWLAEGKSGGKD